VTGAATGAGTVTVGDATAGTDVGIVAVACVTGTVAAGDAGRDEDGIPKNREPGW
jgi:hypothetical protein